MTRPLRFGLIGTGRIGQVHARSIAADEDAELAWVADPLVAGAEAVAARHGGRVTDDPAEVLASGEVDAVVIASPTSTHVDLIAASLDAGVAALCEKPIDLDIARVDALRERVAASDVPVALGFNRRFDPAFADVRARVAAGEIGELEQLTIISRDPAEPPAAYIAGSGGIFRDMTIHDFDMARFFLPGIVEVTAVGSTLFSDGAREHGDFDSAVTTLRTRDGRQVTILNSRHSASGYDQRLEAFGALGALAVENANPSLVRASTATSVDVRGPFEQFFLERYAAAYSAELREFVRLVRGEPATSPTFEDGRAALVLADAAAESARSGRTVAVDLG
jgi:myo-inositol 2-dehydrogenase / D-chiro-inositol 1-dehydrogenase